MDQIVIKDRQRMPMASSGNQSVAYPTSCGIEFIESLLAKLSTRSTTRIPDPERRAVYLMATTLADLLGFDKSDNPAAYYAAKLHLDNIIHFIYAECRQFLSIPHILAIACFESDKVNVMLSLSGKTQVTALALQECFESADLKKLIEQGEVMDLQLCAPFKNSKARITELLNQSLPLFKNRTFLANMGNFNMSKCSLNTLFYERIIKLLCNQQIVSDPNPTEVNSPANDELFNDCLNLVAGCAQSAEVYRRPVAYSVLSLAHAKASVGRKRIKSTL
jgi:hypothetical protein